MWGVKPRWVVCDFDHGKAMRPVAPFATFHVQDDVRVRGTARRGELRHRHQRLREVRAVAASRGARGLHGGEGLTGHPSPVAVEQKKNLNMLI